jgi:hypothetical protein
MITEMHKAKMRDGVLGIRIKCCEKKTKNGYQGSKLCNYLVISKAVEKNREQIDLCPHCKQERRLYWNNDEAYVNTIDMKDSIAAKIEFFNCLQREYQIIIQPDCFSIDKTSVATGNYFGTILNDKDSEFVLEFIKRKTKIVEDAMVEIKF